MIGPRVWFGSEEEVHLFKGLNRNRLPSDFIAKHNLETRTVPYHDVATSPEKTIKSLTEWLGPYI